MWKRCMQETLFGLSPGSALALAFYLAWPILAAGQLLSQLKRDLSRVTTFRCLLSAPDSPRVTIDTASGVA